MEVYLKRIKSVEFDGLIKKVLSHFEDTKKVYLSDEDLEMISENVIVGGKQIRLSYDVNEYMTIVDGDEQTYEKLTKIGMKLHKDSKDIDGTVIPTNVMYEKEVWTYLSFKVFAEVIKKLRLEDDNKMNSDKIQRYYFNVGNSSSKRSRTGLLFIWSMVHMLGSEDEEEITRTAFHFVDPVKAIYERTMSKNPIVLRAFVEAIIKNGCDPRIKNQKYKTKIPKNISCFARINVVDTYQYSNLVDTMAKQIKEVLQAV